MGRDMAVRRSHGPVLESMEPRVLLASDPLQILALGDSITYGVSNADLGYRKYLSDLFGANNIAYNFLGTRNDGPANYDNDHFGWPGAKASVSYTGSGGFVPSLTKSLQDNNVLSTGEKPDVILLHVGTNSINNGVNVAADELETLLNELGDYYNDGRFASDVRVLVAKIIPGARASNGTFSAQRIVNTDAYNDLIPGIVSGLTNSAFKNHIEVVDMFQTTINSVAWNGFTSGELQDMQSDADAYIDWFNGFDESNPQATAFNTNTNLMQAFGDYLHPFPLGYKVIATIWYRALMGGTGNPGTNNSGAGTGNQLPPGSPGGGGGTGSVTREYWLNIPLNTYHDSFNYNTTPTGTSTLTQLDAPRNFGDQYATRIRGYITAPTTGSYTFYISGNQTGSLLLSTDDSPANASEIAGFPWWTSVGQWDKYASQRSGTINLIAGQKYYFEVRHAESDGSDHLQIGWTKPGQSVGNSPAEIIPGSVLSPFTGSSGGGGTNTAPTVPTLSNSTVAENQPAGTVVGTLTSTDAQGDPITYLLSGTHAASFQIVGNQLRTTQAFDFETQSSYSISVRASDGLLQSSNANFTINVGDVNENPGGGGSVVGQVTREYWLGIPDGVNYDSFNWSSTPSGTSTLTSLDTPRNFGDNYATRIRGFITAPTTGSYTFYISGNQTAGLWLSTSDSPASATEIANTPWWTNVNQWDKYASQRSAAINLVAGQRYYFEVRMTDSTGSDHLQVGWTKPGQSVGSSPAEIISGGVLSSYDNGSTPPPPPPPPTNTGTVTREYWLNIAPGSTYDSFNWSSTPSGTSTLTSLDTPRNFGDNYAIRIRGYITAPNTGSYTFYISANQTAGFFLSTSDNPADTTLIASTPWWTNVSQWDKFAEQRSVAINLVAGQRYYFETLMTEQTGSDHLQIGWTRPGQSVGASPAEIISEGVLSAFV